MMSVMISSLQRPRQFILWPSVINIFYVLCPNKSIKVLGVIFMSSNLYMLMLLIYLLLLPFKHSEIRLPIRLINGLLFVDTL